MAPPQGPGPIIFVAAGEASGDQHAAALVRELLKAHPDLRLEAAGGAGLKSLRPAFFVDTAQANATGVTEVIRHLPFYLRTFRSIVNRLRSHRPSLLILVDNPGFNLRLGKVAGKLGIPVVYFICPQVWAWHESRVKDMRRFARKALVIFDFEEKFFKDRGLDAVWVGHPLTDRFTPPANPAAALNGRPRPNPSIALMPGSRYNEVHKLLPVLLGAAALLRGRFPGAEFRLIEADTLPPSAYDGHLKDYPFVRRVRSDRQATVRASDLALVCSGTATLECALMSTPMIIVNRVSRITAFLAKRLIRVKHIGLPNLLAGKMIAPELIQEHCTPARIAEEAERLLTSPDLYAQTVQNLTATWSKVGPPGAPARAAEEILALL